MAHSVTLIPGDGTGPELAEATRRVLEATGVEFDWDVQQAGADVMDEHGGNPLPDDVSSRSGRTASRSRGRSRRRSAAGFRSVNVALRKALDLYAQVRPCKSYPGVRSRYEDVDLVDRPREHRGPLRGDRVRGGHRRGARADRAGSSSTAARLRDGLRASRSSRSRSPARAGSSSSPSTTRAATAAARSRPSTRRTS